MYIKWPRGARKRLCYQRTEERAERTMCALDGCEERKTFVTRGPRSMQYACSWMRTKLPAVAPQRAASMRSAPHRPECISPAMTLATPSGMGAYFSGIGCAALTKGRRTTAFCVASNM